MILQQHRFFSLFVSLRGHLKGLALLLDLPPLRKFGDASFTGVLTRRNFERDYDFV